MDGTVIGQGRFVVASGVPRVTVAIPCGADWMKVINYTRFGTVGGASAFGMRYYWQRGMAAGTGTVEYYANGGAVVTGDTLLSGGFTLYDPSANTLGTAVATTASTDATRPVVSTASTAGIAVGTIVRLSGTRQSDVNGIDMVVGAVTLNTNFTLLTATNPLATTPGQTGLTGVYRIVNYDPLFYPRRRFVVNITQTTNATVSTSVPHQYVPGQLVRFVIPAESGMIQLNAVPDNNYLAATVLTVVDSYNFTIDIDTTSFTAFTWPTIAQQPSSFPEVTPLGENTAAALAIPLSQVPVDLNGQQINSTNSGILSDATVNTGFLGMILGTGGLGAITGTAITGPAGSVSSDVVYWVAGKSTFGGL